MIGILFKREKRRISFGREESVAVGWFGYQTTPPTMPALTPYTLCKTSLLLVSFVVNINFSLFFCFLFLYLYSALLSNTHDIDIYIESGTSLLLGGYKSSYIMY